jgi:molybdopterin synthase catalytic subunit
MRIHVKLFAILRERAGVSDIDIELSPAATVSDAAGRLSETYPQLESFLPRVAYAVNQSYAKHDTALSDGDELALIPPVSGGCQSPVLLPMARAPRPRL